MLKPGTGVITRWGFRGSCHTSSRLREAGKEAAGPGPLPAEPVMQAHRVLSTIHNDKPVYRNILIKRIIFLPAAATVQGSTVLCFFFVVFFSLSLCLFFIKIS